ncbi:hypothetical protein KA005_40120 [bacterium]|nr:hypothetical protein [bacterium]
MSANMPMSVFCEVCRAIISDEPSQMFASHIMVTIPNEAINLLGMAAREITDEDVRNWALNELQRGILRDSNATE